MTLPNCFKSFRNFRDATWPILDVGLPLMTAALGCVLARDIAMLALR